MLVPRKNGKLRLVIDYRQLNNQTIKSCWPISSIEEIFDTLEEGCYFTTIDIWSFYQLPMDVQSQDLTAFSTPFGSFKWLRMLMGLIGSPNTFQSLMECVLIGLTWKVTVPYLDDCIIFARTAEHFERLRAVLERFRNANLKINPTKCEFFRTRVPLLGHIISKDGLESDPVNVKAVKAFPVPIHPTEVKSFLGLCSYYRRYVKDFAAIARPIHAVSESATEFKWTPQAQESFDASKHKLTSTAILAFPSMKKPFILYTDASLTAMGAVLAQVQNGQERANCYASKVLTKAQTRYSATKRELIAVVNFTKKHYLLGQKFLIVTDHRALQWLHNFEDPDALTARWLEKLAAFNYEVVHRPGKTIGHADGLSTTPLSGLIAISSSSKRCSVDLDNDSEWPDRQQPHDAWSFEYSEVYDDILQSKDSIAHCISADFKLGAGVARGIKRRFPSTYPNREAIDKKVLWPQCISDPGCFVYHLITKARYYHKPTYTALRTSLEALRSHAETNGITNIILPRVGCGLDRLDSNKLKALINDVSRSSKIRIIVFLLDPKQKELRTPASYETNTLDKSDTTLIGEEMLNEQHSLTDLEQAQREDPHLKLLINWVSRGTPPAMQSSRANRGSSGSYRMSLKVWCFLITICVVNSPTKLTRYLAAIDTCFYGPITSQFATLFVIWWPSE